MDTKWIVGFVANENTRWMPYFGADDLQDAKKAFEMAVEIGDYLKVGIFRNKPPWRERKPRYLHDNTDKSNAKIRGLEGLINSLPSDYF